MNHYPPNPDAELDDKFFRGFVAGLIAAFFIWIMQNGGVWARLAEVIQ